MPEIDHLATAKDLLNEIQGSKLSVNHVIGIAQAAQAYALVEIAQSLVALRKILASK